MLNNKTVLTIARLLQVIILIFIYMDMNAMAPPLSQSPRCCERAIQQTQQTITVKTIVAAQQTRN